jgi:hypothetical protein
MTCGRVPRLWLEGGKRARGIAYCLRRLSEGPPEAATHPLPIAEPGLAGDLSERQTPLLQHEPRGFETKILDGLGGRLARLRLEYATELARTEPCSFGELFHCQLFTKVLPSEGKRSLNPIRFRVELQHRRVL